MQIIQDLIFAEQEACKQERAYLSIKGEDTRTDDCLAQDSSGKDKWYINNSIYLTKHIYCHYQHTRQTLVIQESLHLILFVLRT